MTREFDKSVEKVLDDLKEEAYEEGQKREHESREETVRRWYDQIQFAYDSVDEVDFVDTIVEKSKWKKCDCQLQKVRNAAEQFFKGNANAYQKGIVATPLNDISDDLNVSREEGKGFSVSKNSVTPGQFYDQICAILSSGTEARFFAVSNWQSANTQPLIGIPKGKTNRLIEGLHDFREGRYTLKLDSGRKFDVTDCIESVVLEGKTEYFALCSESRFAGVFDVTRLPDKFRMDAFDSYDILFEVDI